MACGPHMVGRVETPQQRGKRPTSGITANKPCVGRGRVKPSEPDRRRGRTLVAWVAWAAFAVAIAAAVVTLT